MAPIRWQPVAELSTIRHEMNPLFNTFFEQPAAAHHPPKPGFGGHGRQYSASANPQASLVRTRSHTSRPRSPPATPTP